MIECTNLAADIAQAFADIVDQSMFVGVAIFCAGFVGGFYVGFQFCELRNEARAYDKR